MLNEILNIFEKITKIPHCSGKTQEIREFIISFTKNFNYEIKTDKAGNILVTSKNPLLCLQSHIDMVCVGNSNIEIIRDGDYLRAKNSSLGADNGIGVAIMLYLISQNKNLEFLFTNDEEIGLIGAKNLDLNIKSKYLLNLDSEDDRIVIIGSAGGVDARVIYPESFKKVYGVKGEIIIDKLPGGHSGIDIDKNIPNAIVELLKRVKNTTYIKGGERRNSIPVKVFSEEVFGGNEEIEVYDDKYIHFLKELPHGVIEYDFEYKVPSKSINFALIDGFESVFSLRANTNEKLKEVKEYLLSKTKGAEVIFEDEYPAWAPEMNEFTKTIIEVTNTMPYVVHAGLECGVLKEKFPEVKFASYGPKIENPHTIRERVKISSVDKVFKNILKLIERMENGENI
ncbi:aminoacyl-histidine dipeptidase [Caminibacter mediatlanticus TB-2]|uniref:Aminoacyl-histidine dipeptidase n=1 Tax=Caminibacter mediatlanticus TB-2 TaxID=391592 RepID=A0ABX5VA17_9BACT|nr:M20/M25/M40 family metallo-hydrolase [Caminibacter mediatlanticus]QCT95128.1 aminoacyl-histidine dipeptidase [Caminibacter mediatlanticus TB-2]